MHGTRLSCEALPEALPALQRWLARGWQQLDLPTTRRHAFELVLEELFINVATHGQVAGERIPVVVCSLRSTGPAIELCLQDDGPAFNPLTTPAPATESPLEARTPGGVGIALVRHLMDEVTYRRVDGQNELRCVQHLAGNDSANAAT